MYTSILYILSKVCVNMCEPEVCLSQYVKTDVTSKDQSPAWEGIGPCRENRVSTLQQIHQLLQSWLKYTKITKIYWNVGLMSS